MKQPVQISPVVILAGSNIGDRLMYLTEAKKKIQERIGHIQTSSSVYETAAWGIEEQPDFLNQAHSLNTALTADHVLSVLLDIESEMGRTRKQKWESRCIDLDILFYGDQIISEIGLTIPHPEIANRMFTLVPLLEIMPEFIHPGTGLSIKQMTENCPDTLPLKVFKHI